jgi:zinc protease
MYKKLITLAILICQITIGSAQVEKKNDDGTSIIYEKFTLKNGLEVILHEDHSDPIVAVATVMHVGSNREKPGRTGFAHFFEHMSFNDSENVPVGSNRKAIPEWGGDRNGGTNNDYTVYYEVVPKDAFEKILWIDSDRFGYMINTVTQDALEREKQVVKNEKRQRVDNAAYGYTNEIIRKNLYPPGHPYSWTVIGALPDLQAATIDDVKEFYEKYYGAANATLVIAGDIDIENTKVLVERWFGEIRKGPEVQPLKPQPVKLEQSKLLYFEDNFAKLPELTMVIPTVEKYHKDMYALDILSELLGGSKKSPLYSVIVEEEKLAPKVSVYQSNSELAGEFVIEIRGNAGTELDSVKLALDKSFMKFESTGITSNDLNRVKAQLETDLYTNFSTVLNKAFSLAMDNEFIGDPSYISKTAKLYNDVSIEDIKRVYDQYIKDKNYVLTSVVPLGQIDLAVTGSEKATVWIEEVVQGVGNEEVGQGEEAIYDKTPSKHDRSEPPFSELPLFKSPVVWKNKLQNGLNLYGIENNEVPLVEFDISIPGGHFKDPITKSGVASFLASYMMQGTASKTASELEEAIQLLGSDISIYSNDEEFHIQGSCLSRNFDKTIELVKEIMLEPRWDEVEFARLQKALNTNLKGKESNARSIAYVVFNKILYGDDHILSIPNSGTLESSKDFKISDMKLFYEGLTPEGSSFHIAGDISSDEAMKTLKTFNDWKGNATEMPSYNVPKQPLRNQVFFVDVPGAKQSVLYIGKIALSGDDSDANKLDFANEVLGGGSSGKLTQILRIEKGYTYGAFSFVIKKKEQSPLIIGTSVRSNATLKSLDIIKDIVNDYEEDFTEEEVELTKNKILKGRTMAYEGLSDKLELLETMSKYNKNDDFLEEEQNELISMSLADYHRIINTYMQEEDLVYIIVGDKETQWEEVIEFGKTVTELDVHGNLKL